MIKIDVKLPLEYTAEDVKDSILKLLPVPREEIGETVIVKRTMNISDKGIFCKWCICSEICSISS